MRRSYAGRGYLSVRAYSPSARAAPPESWAQASACDLGERRPLASVGPDYASGKLDEDSTNLGVWRMRTLRSAVLRGQEDRRRADVTAHARSAPGRTASPGSEAPARACAPGEGREMAGVGARGRLVMGWPVLLLLALCAAGARGLYFHIGETEKRCFIEEIPDETMVIGNYRTQMWDKQKEVFLPSTPGLGMHVEVKDPEGKVVLSRQYGSEGRFTFTSHTPGEHQICLHSNSTRMALFAGGRLRVHLDIQVGEHANNYPEIAAKDKLTELQLRARQLLDQVEQIQKEQDYQRYREERFRLTSESTNQRVLWWSIAQTVILILTGIWQMRHLKSFFEAKKLV
ncbi:transmembrane emp24 domain-containing protein 4 [Equus quagga]|uniref:transmembrane emp24 domain-containing protein 4 n=1 Tax=Equus quagga TaxID=89248 RepID=UPI001EE248CD|nr:transmembrane emp24 domain-containing protein 4 [Equus quagga]